MAARTAGVAHVYARALLEHPRTETRGSLKFTTFDAFIRASNVDFVTCILRHISLASDVPISSGTYDIQAKVRFIFFWVMQICELYRWRPLYQTF